jgi:peptidoglycan/xylan/chitin deacetylase (PgdA/CDA1 family)
MKVEALVLLTALQVVVVQGEKIHVHHVGHHQKRQTPAATTTPPPLDTSTTIPPLASISMGMATKAPPSFTESFAPGSTPSLSGAPKLPKLADRSVWPPQDRVPDTSSVQVQNWMKELNGFNIPNIPPTKDGTCAGDPAAAAEAQKRGWWTCGGWTRPTDIVACPTQLDWGLTFDDGPSAYTPNLLNKLREKNTKATFYTIGSRVIDRPQMLLDEYMNGHEIGVHTWSHASLTSLTNEQIVAELGWTRRAIKSVLGVTPTTMRPPKGDIDDRVRAISLAMGLIPVMWTPTPDGGKFDSFDWQVPGGQLTGTQAFANFQVILANGTKFPTGFITLQHDLFEQTVDLAVGYSLDAALNHQPKFNLQTVGQCQKWAPTELYRETSKNSTFPYKNGTYGAGADIDGDGKKDAAMALGVPLWSSFLVIASVVFGGLML